jgi:hypothetical protein
VPTLAISHPHVPENTPSLVDGKNMWIMLRSDYPGIKYWTRAEWASQREVDDIETPPGPRRGLWCAKGENMMMQYIESPDGMLVSGAVASNIREYARSIWRGFYDQGFAPPTWGGHVQKVRRPVQQRDGKGMARPSILRESLEDEAHGNINLLTVVQHVPVTEGESEEEATRPEGFPGIEEISHHNRGHTYRVS